MKWWLLIGLLFLLCGYAPQLRTRPKTAIVRHYGIALMFPKTIIRFEVVRQ